MLDWVRFQIARWLGIGSLDTLAKVDLFRRQKGKASAKSTDMERLKALGKAREAFVDLTKALQKQGLQATSSKPEEGRFDIELSGQYYSITADRIRLQLSYGWDGARTWASLEYAPPADAADEERAVLGYLRQHIGMDTDLTPKDLTIAILSWAKLAMKPHK